MGQRLLWYFRYVVDLCKLDLSGRLPMPCRASGESSISQHCPFRSDQSTVLQMWTLHGYDGEREGVIVILGLSVNLL